MLEIIKETGKYIEECHYHLSRDIQDEYTIIQDKFDKIHYTRQEELSKKIYSIIKRFTIEDLKIYYDNFLACF
jgi:hypothetical protein